MRQIQARLVARHVFVGGNMRGAEVENKAIRAHYLPDMGNNARLVYIEALKEHELDRETVAVSLSMTQTEAQSAIKILLDIGLLQPVDKKGKRLIPVSPDLTRARLLGPLQREVDAAQDSISRLRGELDTLTASYRRSLREHPDSQPSQAVHDPQELRDLINGLAAEAEEEVLISEPGGAGRTEALLESQESAEWLLGRGVRMRTIYQHTARFSPAAVSFAEHVAPLGGEVRTTADGYPPCRVFDATVAVIGRADSPGGAVVVRTPGVVAFIVDGFLRCWQRATPLPIRRYREELLTTVTDIQRAIIAMLVAGETDSKIAERIGLSLRSCQRHIASIMGALGARNRLHLGYLLGTAESVPTAPGLSPPVQAPGTGSPTNPGPEAAVGAV